MKQQPFWALVIVGSIAILSLIVVSGQLASPQPSGAAAASASPPIFSVELSTEADPQDERFAMGIELTGVSLEDASQVEGIAEFALDNNANGVYDEGDGPWVQALGFLNLADDFYSKEFTPFSEGIIPGEYIVKTTLTTPSELSASDEAPVEILPVTPVVGDPPGGSSETACTCKNLRWVITGQNPFDPGVPLGPGNGIPNIIDKDGDGQLSPGDHIGKQFGFSVQFETEVVAGHSPWGNKCPEHQDVKVTKSADMNGDGDFNDPGEIEDLLQSSDPAGGYVSRHLPRVNGVPAPGTNPFGGNTWAKDAYEEDFKDGKKKTKDTNNPSKVNGVTVDFPGMFVIYEGPNGVPPLSLKKEAEFRFHVHGINDCAICATLTQEFGRMNHPTYGLIPTLVSNTFTDTGTFC